MAEVLHQPCEFGLVAELLLTEVYKNYTFLKYVQGGKIEVIIDVLVMEEKVMFCRRKRNARIMQICRNDYLHAF